ncbi:hypothetical protein G6F56_009159 [Rhizopus delemar]|nr:hypothetical protein G6F56_009159 [Rhizopus delemar]
MYTETLEKICIDETCHCDWRLTLQGCVEKKAMTVIHGINVSISGITVIIGTALLCHRVFIKGHQLFDASFSKGCFRPKPIDCMLLFIVIFNFLRLLSSVMLIADFAPDMVSRSFMFEISWQFGYGSFALYLIGIAQTLADSHRVIANSWLPSPKVVDAIGGTLFLAPFIINNCMSLAAGIMATRNLAMAVIFTRLLYVFWFIHCSSLGIAVLYAGLRLTHILESHLKKFNTTAGPRYTSIKTGIFKIRSVMSIIVICVWMFAVFLLLFGILRHMILISKAGSIVLGVMWNFLGAVSTLGVVIAILVNPKIDEPGSLGLKTSSAEKSGTEKSNHNTPYLTYSNFTTQDYSASGSVFSTTIQGGAESGALDELKLQQLQYQQVFQKHNNHLNPRKDQFDSGNNDHIALQDKNTNEDLELNGFSFKNNNVQNSVNHIPEDELIEDDGETSQLDLVEYASKHQGF